ncbi:MAG TPA: prepilin-type N-terminal cleavage/methylation domain-containing protein [Pyrinomonadaceae bacterium]
MRTSSNQNGFSLIELLLVVVIVGVIAAMAVPAYQRGIRAAENGSTFAVLRSISSMQVQYFSSNNRFATLPELQSIMGNGIGVTTGDRVVRGRYVFEMTPISPTPTDLRDGYVISAVRSVSDDVVYRYEVNQSGKITQILPPGGPVN